MFKYEIYILEYFVDNCTNSACTYVCQTDKRKRKRARVHGTGEEVREKSGHNEDKTATTAGQF